MRMWMVPTEFLCRKHLLGEHVETHMFLGSFKKKKNIKGFVENNCAEPLSLRQRHDALAKEMGDRGYNHKSPLDFEENVISYLPKNHINAKVDSESSLLDLIGRCEECKKRYDNKTHK